MKAVILAAGIASRLRPLTDNTPKCLLKVGEKSILGMALENLSANGINEIVIVTGYLGHMIRDFVSREYNSLNVTFRHNEFYTTTNNIYSLWLAAGDVGDQSFLMMDSDIVFDPRVIKAIIDSGYTSCLALKRYQVAEEEIKVRTDDRGCVREISKEVDPGAAAGESVGIEVFGKDLSAELFSAIKRLVVDERNVNIFYEVAFQDLADRGRDIFTVDITDYFCMEIDTAADLKAAAEILAHSQKEM